MEKYMDLLLANSPDVIIMLDPEGRLQYCSSTFLRYIGIAGAKGVRGLNFREIYSAFADEAFVTAAVERFSAVKETRNAIVANVEINFPGRGEPRFYSIQSAPMLGGAGNVEGVLVLMHDSTDLERAEAEERMRVMLDSTPLACNFQDEDARILDCNQVTLVLFGVASKEQFLNEFFHSLSPEFQPSGRRSRELAVENNRRVLASGREEFEWLHRTSSGEVFPAEVTLVRVRWRDGYRVVSYTRDLRPLKASEQKAHEAESHSRELEIQTRAAEVASTAKSRFLASMSHEIRTPMNAIIGMSELFRTDNLDMVQKGFLEDIRRVSRAMVQILNDILDFTKIEAGKMELIPIHFDLLELYGNICSMCRYMAEAGDLRFSHRYDPDVPRVVYGDDVRIRQVITNLLTNAVKYTRKGGVDFRISAVSRDNRLWLVFAVRDTGIGIRREDLPKLFNDFERFDRDSNRSLAGTGLGLPITRNLVEMMEGRLEVESEHGRGSVFTVYLPLVPGDPARVNVHIRPKSVVQAAADTSVLVVDDNAINLKVALAYLAKHGINAETAMNGEDALQMVRKKNYDLVFMDHMMPGMDGLETMRRIRALPDEKYASLPIVALSANALAGMDKIFGDAGMNAFLPKPINERLLNEILARWLPASKIIEYTQRDEDAADGSAVSDALVPPADFSAGLMRKELELAESPNLSPKVGLRNIEGNRELYERLLADFSTDHAGDAQKIRASLELGDAASAHRMAHTLKSVAGQLGALRLQQSALVAEVELKEGSCSKERLSALEEDLLALLAEIGPVPSRSADDGGTILDRGKALDLAGRLAPLLQKGDTKALSLMDEARAVFAPLGGLCSWLVREVEDFEFKRAGETLDMILAALEE
ncbi:MAG: response regulator [Desulfovibrio sp.]|jgi:PAS domain S-box-containing protein|nr:response regulator [Desulfovibrio sp.]